VDPFGVTNSSVLLIFNPELSRDQIEHLISQRTSRTPLIVFGILGLIAYLILRRR